MRLRWGPGPVFVYECVAASRRWQTYAMRIVAAVLPGVGLVLVWWSELGARPLTISRLARTGESFFFALVSIQLTLVLLAAPAYTAGSICLDKMRGTLLHLLVTDLSNAEVELGKLAARLLPVLGLILAAVPVLFGAVLLGGIAPKAAIGALLVMLGVAVFASALALTLSVWLRKTQEVLLLVYLCLIIALLLIPIWNALWSQRIGSPPPQWLEMSNPYVMAFQPYLHPGKPCLKAQAEYLGITLALSAALVGSAVLRVRAVAIRQAGRPQRANRLARWFRTSLLRGLSGPLLDRNPVLWRERHRRRLSSWSGWIWALYMGLALLFSLWAIAERPSNMFRYPRMAILGNAIQVSIGLLLLCVSSVTSLAEERGRGSLDVLLTTPLSALQILQGKWWGAYRTVFFLVPLPSLVAIAVALPAAEFRGMVDELELIALIIAALTGLGLALDAAITRKGHALTLAAAFFVMLYSGLVVGIAALSTESSRKMIGMLLLAAEILAAGAAVTSLGLALATWIARPGRALAMALTLFVLLTVVPVFLRPRLGLGSIRQEFISASPFVAIGKQTAEIWLPNALAPKSPSWMASDLFRKSLWLGGCLAAAFILFLLTWMTFQRCLGRIDRRMPPSRVPRVRARQVSAVAGES